MYLWGEGETRTSVMHSNSQYNSEILTGQHLPSLYGDHFSGYHQFGDPLVNPPAGAWEEALREDEWAAYGHSFTDLSSGAGQTAGYIPPGVPGGVSFPTLTHNSPAEVDTPQLLQGRRCNDWMKNSVHPSVPGGKTRTKDKYRVVYTDYQRLELEKEFQYSLYITIRRKAELSLDLGLTERQVKIWFQNRRAKERKLTRRKLQLSQQAPTATPAQPNNTSPSSDNALSHTVLMAVKEEF